MCDLITVLDGAWLAIVRYQLYITIRICPQLKLILKETVLASGMLK